ncbi:MAG: sugar transferase [Desulfomonile tiedjei]|uniref:Sugar transferase n=1 Tax=Desulfomonile tiedjei TaxID=2358 RepID=A0A9D6Z6A8_9BACT|nr:sugar transferase [Desulfomonile tiedjei]
MNRVFGFIIAFTGLLIAAPVMLAIAVLIKLESRGPVFYRCTRVGEHGKIFGMLKFRTMIQNADTVDCKLCGAADVRVTSFGMFLRRTKLNELPQLINVLVGDMAMVGPRPEDLKFVHYYREQWNTVLSVRPGIVGPNQILHRNEEDLLQGVEDPEAYYVKNLLPEKLKRDIDYVNNRTLGGDLKILCSGVYVTIFKAFRLNRLRSRGRILGLMSVDVALTLLAYLLANFLRHETLPSFQQVWISYGIILVSSPFVFVLMGLYRCSLRFFSVPDMMTVGKISLVSAAWLVTSNYLLMAAPAHSRIVYALYPALMFLLIGGTRVAIRSFIENRERRNEEPASRRVLIYGAGRLGVETLKRLQFQSGIEVVGFVDDNPRIKGRSILGMEILGSGLDLLHLKLLHGAEAVVISFKPANEADFAEVRRKCVRAEIPDFVSPAILWDLPQSPTDATEALGPCYESSELPSSGKPPDSNHARTDQSVGRIRIVS